MHHNRLDSLARGTSAPAAVNTKRQYRASLNPRRALRGGISKAKFEQSPSTFGNKCP